LLSHLVRCATLALAVSLGPTALAAPIPFAERNVQLTAREQPVALFLSDLFGLVDLPVSVSERVRGAVNGNFEGNAERVWMQIARSFNLVAYYDGSVVHIASPGELATRTLPS
jgi:type III secretion protein C